MTWDWTQVFRAIGEMFTGASGGVMVSKLD